MNFNQIQKVQYAFQKKINKHLSCIQKPALEDKEN